MNKNSAFAIEVVTAAGLVAAILIAQTDYVAGFLFLVCGGALWATSPQLSHANQDKHRRVELLGGVGVFSIVLALAGYLIFPMLKLLKFNSGFARAPGFFMVAGLVLLWGAQALYRKLLVDDKPLVGEGQVWRALALIERNGLDMGGFALIATGLFLSKFAGKFYEVRKPAVWMCIVVVAIGVGIVGRALFYRFARGSADTNRTTP
jgi:hypothetical protein